MIIEAQGALYLPIPPSDDLDATAEKGETFDLGIIETTPEEVREAFVEILQELDSPVWGNADDQKPAILKLSKGKIFADAEAQKADKFIAFSMELHVATLEDAGDSFEREIRRIAADIIDKLG